MLGERHPEYAQTLNNLAVLLESQGDYAAARPLLEKALALRQEMLGERHPDYALGLNNLATLLDSQGDYAAARRLHEKALAIRKEVLGEGHPDYAQSVSNLAYLLALLGDYTAARPLFEQALAIHKAALGDRHPVYAKNLSNLSSIHWAKRDYAKAAALQRQAWEIAQGNLQLASAAQSERQQLAMARFLRWHVDACITMEPTIAKVSPGDAYHPVLAFKGAVFERQRRLRVLGRRLRADPRSDASMRLKEYCQTVEQLATLALAMPDSKQPHLWRAQVDKLSRRKDELEARLSRLDTSFLAELAGASLTPERLQTSLACGTALIDLFAYTAT